METNVFEELAKRYDTPFRKELAEVIVKEVRAELKGIQPKTLIDYGSGTGLVGLELTDLAESVQLMDSSKQMLEVAEAKIGRQGIANATVRYADFMKELPDVQADVVLLSLVLLHIPDTEKILKQLHTILSDGGTLLIVDFDKNELVSHPKVHNGFTPEELHDKLTEAGFSSISRHTFYEGSQLFVNQDASLFLSSCVKAG